MSTPQVEVRRSARRRRSVAARREGEVIIVQIPASLTAAEEEYWVLKLVRQLEASERRRRKPHISDTALAERARTLSRQYLDATAVPASVRWVSNQRSRWGSCSPVEGTIRLSDRLRGFPRYVIDYVLLHELIHLLHAGHGPEFRRLLAQFPQGERAEGFLIGFSYATHTSNPAPANSADSADSDPLPLFDEWSDETGQGRLFP